MRFLPGKPVAWLLLGASALALAALLAGLAVRTVAAAAAVSVALFAVAALVDAWRSRRAWLNAAPELERRLPPAFAIGVRREVSAVLTVRGHHAWQGDLFDHVDGTVAVSGLPARIALSANERLELSYAVVPSRRGEIELAPAQLRLRSLWRLCDLDVRIGAAERRRVYPDFAQIARYAWLAGDRRLQEIGIKTYRQRGEGTDFKQLSEYRFGDSVRHIDWKASLRLDKPIVREFQDERDQCVMLLVDCGRRMRADDRQAALGTAHFDEVLNAVMLLAYVALRQGDAVGALTFGTPPAEQKLVAARKGGHALGALMSELYGVQPTPSHSDYVAAAQELLRRQSKRALVIVVTNFRDEDATELALALQLLRSRHLVLLASVRERVVGELIAQPLGAEDAPLEVASAQLYEQARRDAFRRLSARDALLVDAEPDRLGVELVNRYRAVKRAGLI